MQSYNSLWNVIHLRKKNNTSSQYFWTSARLPTPYVMIPYCKKLQKSRIRANYLTLFQSYLSNRSKYVEVNVAKHLPFLITCGVPQGCTLDPLLFLLYVNDSNQSSEHLKFIQFADDSTFYAKGTTLSYLTFKINQELQNVIK